MAHGHPQAWDYTPRMLAGHMHFAMEHQKREMAAALSLHAMAARGDPKEIKKILKEAER